MSLWFSEFWKLSIRFKINFCIGWKTVEFRNVLSLCGNVISIKNPKCNMSWEKEVWVFLG